ncbi:MAG: hypothetical protein ACYC64_18185 [Armatimonadota bacterium]
MNCRKIVFLSVALMLLFSLSAQAHRDNNASTNFVMTSGVTCVSNGDLGAPYVGQNAILNADRTADPQADYAGAFHSSSHASANDVVTLTITFPSSVTINHVAWNTGTAGWIAATSWSVYADGNKIVNNKSTKPGGPGALLAEPYGAIPAGSQHEAAYFSSVTCSQVKIEIKPIAWAGAFYYSVRDINVGAGDVPPGDAPVQILYQPTPTSNYMLYQYGLGTLFTLLGTSVLSNGILADVDGDGAKDEIVYTDGTTGGISYYEIPNNGLWTPGNVHNIPGAPAGAIPQAVLHTGAHTPGIVIYKSGAPAVSYAVALDGTALATLGNMKRVYAVDARLQGYDGDLLWCDDFYISSWREGLSGAEHALPLESTWIPAGGGKLLPGSGNAGKTMLFLSGDPTNINAVLAVDKDLNYVQTNAQEAWEGPYGFQFGDLTGDGLDDLLFMNSSGVPIQWMRDFNDAGVGAYGIDWITAPGPRPLGVTHIFITPPVSTPVSSIEEVRNAGVGSAVSITGLIKTTTLYKTASNGSPSASGFYAEASDRSAGIKVNIDGGASDPAGTPLVIAGFVTVEDGQKVLNAYDVHAAALPSEVIKPVYTSVKSVTSQGLTMNGLLVRLTGTVTSVHSDADPLKDCFTISDGSPQEITVYSRPTRPIAVVGTRVRVDGSVGAATVDGTPVPIIIGGYTYIYQDGQNMVINGDFETGDLTGWTTWNTTWGGPYDPSLWDVQSGVKNSGTYALHMGGPTGCWGIYQIVDVVPGRSYALNATWKGNGDHDWIEIQLANGDNCLADGFAIQEGRITARVVWPDYQLASNNGHPDPQPFDWQAIPGSGYWDPASTNVLVATGTTMTVEVKVGATPGSVDGYFDDISVVEVP